MRHLLALVRHAACIGATLGLLVQPAAATTISFDDLLDGAEYAPIVNAYAGFDWTNFNALDTGLYTIDVGANGYANGVVSGPNVAYAAYGNPAGFSAGQQFTLNSYAIGAAWNNAMAITVQGWRNGILVASDSFLVDSTGSTLRHEDWRDIDAVTFRVTAAGMSGTYSGYGPQFYLDSVRVNEAVIDEPASVALVLTAAGLLLAGRTASRQRPARPAADDPPPQSRREPRPPSRGFSRDQASAGRSAGG